MTDPNHSRSGFDHGHSARVLALMLSKEVALLTALTSLRELGDDAHQAIEAVLELRRVQLLSASWELWDSLAASDDINTDELLTAHVGGDFVRFAREALFGDAG